MVWVTHYRLPPHSYRRRRFRRPNHRPAALLNPDTGITFAFGPILVNRSHFSLCILAFPPSIFANILFEYSWIVRYLSFLILALLLYSVFILIALVDVMSCSFLFLPICFVTLMCYFCGVLLLNLIVMEV